MPALQPQPETITLEQYEALSEDKRVEVFDGIAYDMASPSQTHQSISMQLSTVINNYLLRKKGDCSIFSAPFDVKLSDNPLIIVQPDIMVVCEIVSPGNPSDDYIRKLYYYKNYGVREYWIVDPKRKIITVNYFKDNIVSVQYSFDSIIKVNIYDDLYINFFDIAKLLNI